MLLSAGRFYRLRLPAVMPQRFAMMVQGRYTSIVGGMTKRLGVVVLAGLVLLIVPQAFPKTRGNVRKVGTLAPAVQVVGGFITKGGA